MANKNTMRNRNWRDGYGQKRGVAIVTKRQPKDEKRKAK
jgi:hypothetical protein